MGRILGGPGGRGKLSNSKKVKPLVGVPTCRQIVDGLDYDCTQHKYIRALHLSADVLPLQIPLLGNELELESILARLDGIMLTGSHSNIHPQHYAPADAKADFKLDQFRDETILPLIKPVIEQGIPFFAICRGFQELNVAYGGELNPHLYQEDIYIEHRENKELDLAERYELAHTVELVPGGKLHSLFKQDSIEVNSLHEQGIRSIGKGLRAEGHSEDGLIEAVSVDDSSNFAIGVQWHPEWKSTENQVSTRLFSAFGEACAAYAKTTQR